MRLKTYSMDGPGAHSEQESGWNNDGNVTDESKQEDYPRLIPELEQTERFLKKLDDKAKAFCFFAFPDKKVIGSKKKPSTLYGTLEEHKAELTRLNNEGFGIAVTVNETRGKDRKKTDIERIRSIWVEDDKGNAPDLPIEPHLKIESSTGKYHSYILTDTEEVDEFEAVQQRLVDDFGSDPNAKDRPRVLRLPGFYHQKNPDKPFLVKIIAESKNLRFDWEEIKQLFPPVKPKIKNKGKTKAKFDIEECRSALNEIDPDIGYNQWISIGMALKSIGDDLIALQLWDEWSQKGVKYVSGECSKKWKSFAVKKMNLNPLYSLAYDAGWDKPAKNINSLKLLLKKYIYVSSLDKIYDINTGKELTKQGFSARWLHRHKEPKATSLFLGHQQCIKVDDLIYLPGNTDNPINRNGEVYWNIWQKPKISLPSIANDKDVAPWLGHLNYLYPNKVEQAHLLDWFASILQNPMQKINHGVLVAGTSRVGKDLMLNPIRFGVGEKNICEPSALELEETYTEYLHHAKLVIFQEMKTLNGIKIENKLKPMLASPPDILRVRRFHQGFYETPNMVQAIFMSNYKDSLYISPGDGRYFAVWTDVKPKDSKYYKGFVDWLDNGGNGLVVRWLLSRDLSSFDPKAPAPMTAFKRGLVNGSKSSLGELLEQMINALDRPFDVDIIRSTDIFKFFNKKYSVKAIGMALIEIGCIKKECRRSSGKREKLALYAVRSTKQWGSQGMGSWLKHYDL